MEAVLETEGLCKQYGDVRAVDQLTLTLRRGEIYGFLGRNGAGKTTTIRMLLGLSRPESGAIRLFGKPLAGKGRQALHRVGALSDRPGFYDNLTARENLAIHARLTGIIERGWIEQTMRMMGVEDDQRKRVGQFSPGMRQRLGLARALLSHPELLILDEPMNALDPAGIHDIRQHLIGMSHEYGTAIFLSSHILGEVEQMADRVGVIHQGRLIEEFTLADLRDRNRACLEFRVSDENRTALLLERDLGITDFVVPASGLVRVYSRLDAAAIINRHLVEGGVEVSGLTQSSRGLEEYFLNLTGEQDA